ncbi:MAG: rRNA processing protein RimM [Solirubrobacterales bacterium]|nr:rRNA processing protein RimM [Solirubrobacterales bacterium]
MTEHARHLRAGRVGRPHGLDGSVHVVSPVAALLAEGAVVLVDGRQLEVVRRAGTDERPIIRLAGCSDRASAEALRGRELLAPGPAPALDEDEWWIADLEGCAVWDGEREVGVVAAVRPLPSCEVLEVRRVGGDGSDELLVPLVRDAVRSVDVAARRIDVDLEFLGESGGDGSGDAAPPGPDNPAAGGPHDPAPPGGS